MNLFFLEYTENVHGVCVQVKYYGKLVLFFIGSIL